MDYYVLNDGRVVAIRPIRPEDGQRLQAHHHSLSERSRYRRFLTPKPHLTQADTRYLADIDGCNHFALVATEPANPGEDGPIRGVARFVRLEDEPATAEFAIVVSDSHQGQGLAREMMERLAQAAAERGIERFRGTTLADNVPVRRLLQGLAAGPVRTQQRGTVTELEIELAQTALADEAHGRRAPLRAHALP